MLWVEYQQAPRKKFSGMPALFPLNFPSFVIGWTLEKMESLLLHKQAKHGLESFFQLSRFVRFVSCFVLHCNQSEQAIFLSCWGSIRQQQKLFFTVSRRTCRASSVLIFCSQHHLPIVVSSAIKSTCSIHHDCVDVPQRACSVGMCRHSYWICSH